MEYTNSLGSVYSLESIWVHRQVKKYIFNAYNIFSVYFFLIQQIYIYLLHRTEQAIKDIKRYFMIDNRRKLRQPSSETKGMRTLQSTRTRNEKSYTKNATMKIILMALWLLEVCLGFYSGTRKHQMKALLIMNESLI